MTGAVHSGRTFCGTGRGRAAGAPDAPRMSPVAPLMCYQATAICCSFYGGRRKPLEVTLMRIVSRTKPGSVYGCFIRKLMVAEKR